MICPICKEKAEFYESSDFKISVRIVAFDKPYMNVYCHISCINNIGENLNSFIKDNIDAFTAEKAVNIGKRR